jgi:protoporphyrinogen oxidase
MKRIIIIGGGVTGLGAAYKITRAASGPTSSSFCWRKTVGSVERIQTEVVMDPSKESRFIVDGGPDCFLTKNQLVTVSRS